MIANGVFINGVQVISGNAAPQVVGDYQEPKNNLGLILGIAIPLGVICNYFILI